jgi:hypothetical protein
MRGTSNIIDLYIIKLVLSIEYIVTLIIAFLVLFDK